MYTFAGSAFDRLRLELQPRYWCHLRTAYGVPPAPYGAGDVTLFNLETVD